MKQFFKFMFASMLGFIVSGVILIFIFVGVLVGALSSAFESAGKKTTDVEDKSVLHISLTDAVVDRGSEHDFNFSFPGFDRMGKIGLDQTIQNLEKAAKDDKINGIFLDLSSVAAGMSAMEEIRNALIEFKSTGKWIVSYSETYNLGSYYLASVSDEIYIYPEGSLDFRGLRTEIMFMKGMLDKLDIEPQIIRGPDNKYKSAVEPFMLDKMSDSNREQIQVLINSAWGNILSGISEARGIPVDELETIADGVLIRNAHDAVKYGMADATMYKDELLDLMRTKLEIEKKDDINFVGLKKYFRAPEHKDTKDIKKAILSGDKDKIAVVYAIGAIESGDGDNETIGSERISKAIREARLDTTVKAIVLRVNSPGGSALASDVIWRETVLAKEVKPVVVSMGDVAASGGYYIACAANKIIAMPNTITGSIGVFGMIPNMQKFFNNKLGITFDGVKTNEYADMMTVSRALTDKEMAIIEESVVDIYDDFIDKVAKGRNMSPLKVEEAARGRVWTGTDALAIGLVDELGGLEYAVASAAELAGIEDYKIKKYPEIKDPFEELMKEITGQTEAWAARMILGDDLRTLNRFKQAQQVQQMEGIQMLMPYQLELNW